VGESIELVKFSLGVGKWSSMTLSEAGGGILMAPHTFCLSLCPVFTELVDQRQEECNLELVVCRSEEDEVDDYAIEAFPVEKQVESCEPMVLTPLAMEGIDGQRVSPRWVVDRVKNIYQIIGLSCEGSEDKLVAIFEEIEDARDSSLEGSKTKFPSSQRVKGQRELNRLAWSINYEKKGVQSVSERHRGRGPSRSYEA
jgi:hypothetical protein